MYCRRGRDLIIRPNIRNGMCLTAHPEGCNALVEEWIDRSRARSSGIVAAAKANGKEIPKAVLVLGSSTGYGLASRITAAFGLGAQTIGVSYEREPGAEATASPGWYNNRAFDRAAKAAGIYAHTFSMDAFSDKAREEVIHRARLDGIQFDHVIYSLASPVRRDPQTGVLHKSTIRPFGNAFSGTTIDPFTGKMSEVSIEPAEDERAAGTVKVMGGEDWELWIDALLKAGVLARNCTTIAYSYIGPEHSWPVYRNGTIGKAKEHLELTAHSLDKKLGKELKGSAFVSVNKALVTRASSVIPIIPLYMVSLFKTMKEMGLHEDCVDQIHRLYRERLFAPCKEESGWKLHNCVPVDDERRIRIDDQELRYDVQEATTKRMREATEENLALTTDLEGYKRDFLQAHGFGMPGVDYEKDISPL